MPERQLLVTEDGLYVRQRRRWSHGTVRAARGGQSGDALQRRARASLRHALARHHGTQGRAAGGRNLCTASRADLRASIPTSPFPMRSVFRRTERSAISPTPRPTSCSASRSTRRPACRSASPRSFIRHTGVGGLDGAVVDADGLIWNARWGGGCVDVYDANGRRLRSLRVPARQSSCPAFVGRDLVAASGDLGLAGHGRNGPRRGSRARPDLHSGRRGAWPRRARCEARRALSRAFQPGKITLSVRTGSI